MQIYPAIDIKRGKVVRVMERGGAETVYADDPVAQAEAFLAAGATWLHVVDLDRAYKTGGDNTPLVGDIVATARTAGASVQVGGLLATVDDVSRILKTGAARAIVATVAAFDELELERIVRSAGATRLGLAIDLRGGEPVLRGSTGTVPGGAAEIARRALARGVEHLVCRDLDRDGVLGGFALDDAEAVARLGGRVIVAGGGASLADLEAARGRGMSGAIIGRALYERRFTLGEAIACSG